MKQFLAFLVVVVIAASSAGLFAITPYNARFSEKVNPKNVSITQLDDVFSITVDSSTCGTGQFMVLCYFTNFNDNCIILDAGIPVGGSAKITNSVDVESLLGDRKRNDVSNVVRFDVFQGQDKGSYGFIYSRLISVAGDAG